MKRLIIVLLMLHIGCGLKAQCPLHEAVDFTVNDCSGNEIHLFDLLDGGQYVLIDFFFTTCGGCHEIASIMGQAYQAFGCNRHDVVFLEIDDGDNEQQCLNWINQYGVEYPTISGDAGGTAICNRYFIDSFPTVILIAPDHSIVIRDLWPLDDLQNIVNALENKGLEQHACFDELDDMTLTPLLFPNPANESLTLTGESLGRVEIFNTLGQLIDSFETSKNELIINTSHYNNGVYLMKTDEKTLRFVIHH